MHPPKYSFRACVSGERRMAQCTWDKGEPMYTAQQSRGVPASCWMALLAWDFKDCLVNTHAGQPRMKVDVQENGEGSGLYCQGLHPCALNWSPPRKEATIPLPNATGLQQRVVNLIYSAAIWTGLLAWLLQRERRSLIT